MKDSELELAAYGPEPSMKWRRTIPIGKSVRIGRAPANGWAVPWDQRISREHADLVLSEGAIIVRCLEQAKNAANFDGQRVREFTVRPGDQFSIGVTKFRVESIHTTSMDSDATIDENIHELLKQAQSDSGEAAKELFAGKANLEEAFDPYHRWLGIPPSEQPPNLYRLLGIAPLEHDLDVIESAADRQMAHVRGFQSGQRADLSQKLMNELSSAKLRLLQPDKKAEYDKQLRAHFASQDPSAGETTTATIEEYGPVSMAAEAYGGYELLDVIGRGQTGTVFKAQHSTMGRTVALKVLLNDSPNANEAIARFNSKVAILSRLNHKNIVAVYDAGQREDTSYMVMEFIDCRDLLAIMKAQGALPVKDVLDYVIQAAEGLSDAHAAGVVHRNVKPAKLLVDKQGVVKIIGWGYALFTGDQSLAEPSQKKVVGTIDYMSPEQALDSSKVDYRADVYSLGCAMFVLLTRQLVFPGKTAKERLIGHQQSPVPSIHANRPEVPPGLDLVFQKMLAKKPADRYQSMHQVIAALQAVQHSTAPAVPAAPVVPATSAMPAAPATPAALPPQATPTAFPPQAAPAQLPEPIQPAFPQPVVVPTQPPVPPAAAPIPPAAAPIPPAAAPAPPTATPVQPDSESANLANFLGNLSEEERKHWKRKKR